jgi:hypothetical protein
MMADMTFTVPAAPALGLSARASVRGLYEELDAEVANLGPVCRLSGLCCRFREYGHTLFVSTAEVLFLLESAPEPKRPLDHGETCPWQDSSGRCTARECRPLGCRVYHCDPSYEPSAHELSERYIARLKELTMNHGLPWNYAPLHHHLQEQQAVGSYVFAQSAQTANQTQDARDRHGPEWALGSIPD